MGNNNKWIEIDSVEKALEWFELVLDKDFESEYRNQISGKETFTSEFINDEENSYRKEYYNSQFERSFDPDSSPLAWEHYIRHYTAKTFGETLDEYEDKDKINKGIQSYSFEGLKYYGIRIYVVPEVYAQNLGSKTLTGALERIGGDCDFNFGNAFKKYEEKLINDESRELLKNCKELHHSLLNFSLMQSKGNMQSMKKPAQLDRADSLINKLSSILPIKQPRNIREQYLSNFKNIYDYCAKIYFLPSQISEKERYLTGMMEKNNITDAKNWKEDWIPLLKRNKDLIDELIKSGEKTFEPKTSKNNDYIKTNHDLAVDYMLLAVRFWQAKEEYFNLIDNVKQNNAE